MKDLYKTKKTNYLEKYIRENNNSFINDCYSCSKNSSYNNNNSSYNNNNIFNNSNSYISNNSYNNNSSCSSNNSYRNNTNSININRKNINSNNSNFFGNNNNNNSNYKKNSNNNNNNDNNNFNHYDFKSGLKNSSLLSVICVENINNLDTNIISVISNKGGVGKTTFAVCAGFYYSMCSNSKTLIIELDSSPGDFNSIFDIETENSIEMALKFPSNFQNYKKSLRENLDVMKGLSDPLAAEGVGREEIYRLINNICKEYKTIIFDTQTVLNSITLDVLLISKTIFLISDFSLESMNRILKLFEMLTKKFLIQNSKIKLIFNKKRLLDFFKVWDFSRISNLPVEGFISFDKSFNKMLFSLNCKKVFNTRIYKQLKCILDYGD